YDANALYGNTVRDLLIRIAQSDLVQAKWTDKILDEMLDNLGRNRPDIATKNLSILRDRMNDSIRDVLVTDYEPLIEGLDLRPRAWQQGRGISAVPSPGWHSGWVSESSPGGQGRSSAEPVWWGWRRPDEHVELPAAVRALLVDGLGFAERPSPPP